MRQLTLISTFKIRDGRIKKTSFSSKMMTKSPVFMPSLIHLIKNNLHEVHHEVAAKLTIDTAENKQYVNNLDV